MEFGSSGTYITTPNAQIDCNEPTDTITMHAKNLNIDAEKVTLKSEDQENDGRAPAIVDTSLQPAEDFVVIKLLQSLKRGQRYVVELHFEGELEQNLVGFYRIYYYFGEEREQRWLALTHFKPYHARRVFPCFDEPIFMAKFLLSIGRSENYTSIGNMPLDRTEKM